jgi:guanylate kinase
LIVSGPSGSGKSTLADAMIRKSKWPLRRSVSSTTRSMRPGEIDGDHYHFWSRDRFEKAVAAKEMLEWAVVFERDYYGTPVCEVDPYRERGTGVILVIDVQGAAQVRRLRPDAYSVFLMAPDGEYERRIRARGEADEAIERRMRSAREEIARAGEYSETLVNDDLDLALAKFEAILTRLFGNPQQGNGNAR